MCFYQCFNPISYSFMLFFFEFVFMLVVVKIGSSSYHPIKYANFACSDFIHIFDVDWFMSYLAKDVTIVRRVPEKVMRNMDKPPYTMRVPRKSEPEYYIEQVLPILLRRRVRPLCRYLMNSILFDCVKQ